MSDSFSIEFASSSHKGLTIKKNGFNKDLIVEECASNSIIFKDSDASHIQVGWVSCSYTCSNSADSTVTL